MTCILFIIGRISPNQVKYKQQNFFSQFLFWNLHDIINILKIKMNRIAKYFRYSSFQKTRLL